MRSQITAMTHNLLFTRGGAVWATWRLTPQAYGYRPDEAKSEVRAVHTALLRALPGEALLLGLEATMDPAAIVERMIEGVDIEQHEAWAEECEASLDLLEEIPLGRRSFWLSVPLANDGVNRWREPLRAAAAHIADQLALPRVRPPASAVAQRLAQAEELRKALPDVFAARPIAVAEQVWIHLHAQQRGLGQDLPVPGADPESPEAVLLRSPSALPTPVLDPAGQTDEPAGKGARTLDLFKRRYLKVINADTGAASYQSMLVVADTPAGGIVFPGGEWLGRIDESGIPLDWAMRLTIHSRDEVTQRNRRANRNLADQLDQRENDTRAGSTSGLVAAAGDLADYQALMDADELEVEVEATTIFTVAGATPQEAQDSARDLTKFFAGAQFKLTCDPGAQEALWWSTLPGSPTSRVVREYSQISPARHLSVAVPVITTEIGDRKGNLLGLEISNGQPSPVLVDLAGSGAEKDVAMAIGVVGELGSGKSVFMKSVCAHAVARGASIVAIDRSAVGEWAKAMAPIRGSAVVQISADASLSFDPLRVFAPAVAGRVTQSFLTALLNITPMSEEGQLLSQVLESSYLARHDLTSLGALRAHLEQTTEFAVAREVARKMAVFARLDLGRAVFDASLPPVDIASPVIVFRTNLLELPTADELNNTHRFDRMSLEKVFGGAVYALITAVARARNFADGRLGIFAVDEAHSVTCSPVGSEELKLYVRDGRKHLAALVIGSHDPESDFGDEVLRGLIPFRVLMRHRDTTLAERGVRWLLGIRPDSTEPFDRSLIKLIAEDTSPLLGEDGVPPERRGECLVRDFRSRIGRCKVLAPATPALAAAVLTTPTAGAAS